MSAMTIYLYVKIHCKTGLKYLGKTSSTDPHAYHGSGSIWKAHLKEHGTDYSTEIIQECQTNQELSQWGRYYSNLWNVAKDSGWANQIPETGGGGTPTEETKCKLSAANIGKPKTPRTKEHTENQAATTRGKPNPKTSNGLRKWYGSNPDRSATIEKQSQSVKKWYQKNPELAHQKALNTWATRYKKDYNKYKTTIQLIAIGKTNTEIQSIIKIDYATIMKLRNNTHRVFVVFPEFIQLLGT